MRRKIKGLLALLLAGLTLLAGCSTAGTGDGSAPGAEPENPPVIGGFVETVYTTASEASLNYLVRNFSTDDGRAHFFTDVSAEVNTDDGSTQFIQKLVHLVSNDDGELQEVDSNWQYEIESPDSWPPSTYTMDAAGNIYVVMSSEQARSFRYNGSTFTYHYSDIWKVTPDGTATKMPFVEEFQEKIIVLSSLTVLSNNRLLVIYDIVPSYIIVDDEVGEPDWGNPFASMRAAFLDLATGEEIPLEADLFDVSGLEAEDYYLKGIINFIASDDAFFVVRADGEISAYSIEDGRRLEDETIQLSRDDFRSLISADEESIYFIDGAGIHRIARKGSVVETIVDGGRCEIGSPTRFQYKAVKTADDEFYTILSGVAEETMVCRYRFDPELVVKPVEELTVFVLNESY